ncbi:hypothetical protein FHS82_002855 [Pseudochelatococcus lubricantis]|uniref:Uncharacterized protein n=1 Tax=Pseudochelatococcus lubricantis TaxID=1538102 RepID=A0ABX0V3Q3_9HYPH|nr:hypothetical protein [Pseudochelatococcus lubricantis]NIJ59000.1 hypothetical protein [Pseudochelatococcus lubricantis]
MRRIARTIAAAIVGAAGIVFPQADGARAQSLQGMPREASPEGFINPEENPYPFDPRRILKEYFEEHLPTSWWINDPLPQFNSFLVTIHIPAHWRGNPVQAVMTMCPEHNDSLWNGLKTLDLQPYYQRRPWPTVTCRP